MMLRVAWWVMFALAVGVAGYGLAFALVLGFAEVSQMKHHFAARPLAMYVHFLFGAIALVIGIFQFRPLSGRGKPRWHRYAGRVYVASCMFSGVAAIQMSFDSVGGPVAGAGFFMLGAFWLVITGLGFWHARSRRIADHRRWMIRSYALTFAAVTLRLQLGLFIPLFGFEFMDVYAWIAWSCWVPNLLFAEWYVRRPVSEPTGQAA